MRIVMESRIKIGFFDSGVGGISVMAYARQKIKNADYIYYADTEHVPFGKKTREEIIGYSDEAISYLVKRGVRCVVIACNTATSMAIEYLRKKYRIPLIGMEPAVKPASIKHHGEKILVCATPVTIGGEKLHTLIDKSFERNSYPTLVATPELVTFAENAVFDTEKVTSYLRTVIDTSEKYTAVVLGCTHFSYFRDSFRKLLGDIDIIDGTAGTVNRLAYILNGMGIQLLPDSENTPVEYIISGKKAEDRKILDYYNTLEMRSMFF